jgi:hypothetical protein
MTSLKMITPLPHPMLKSLTRLVGTWNVSGEAHGQVTFKWMEGGFFMVQDVNLIGAKGIEFIGYDETTNSLRSHYFDSAGKYLEYTYRVSETEHIVLIDMPGVKGRFKGRFSNNGNTISGDWKWVKDGEELGYHAVLNKIMINHF